MSQSKIEALKNSHRRSAIKQEILPHSEPLMRPTRDKITDNKTTPLNLKQIHAIDTTAYQKRIQQLQRQLQDYQFEHQANQVYNRQFKVLGKLFGNEQLQFDEILKKIQDTILNSNIGSGFGSSNQTLPFNQPYKITNSLENDHSYEEIFQYSHEELKNKLIEANRSQFLSILNLGSSINLQGQSLDQRKKKQLRQKFFIIWRQLIDQANFQDKTIKNSFSLLQSSKTQQKINNFEKQIIQKNKQILQLTQQLEKLNFTLQKTQQKLTQTIKTSQKQSQQTQQLQTNNQHLLSQIQKLKSHIQKIQDQSYFQIQKQKQLTQQNNQKQQNLILLKQQIKQIKIQKQLQCQNMITKIDQLINNINQYDNNINNLQSQKNQLLRQLWVHKANQQTLTNKSLNYQNQIIKLNQNILSLQNQLKTNNQNQQSHKIKSQNQHQKYQQKIQQLTQQLKSQTKQYNQKHQQLNQNLKQINSQKTQLQNLLKQKQTQIQQIQQNIIQKQQQKQNQLSKDLQNQYHLQQIQQKTQKQIQLLTNQIQQLTNLNLQKQSKLTQQNIHYQNIINNLNTNLQQNLQNYQKLKQTHQNQSNQTHTLIINNNQQIIQDYENDIQSLNQQLISKLKQIQIYQQNIKQFQQKIIILSEINNSQNNQQQIQNLQSKILTLQSQLSKTQQTTKTQQEISNKYQIELKNQIENNQLFKQQIINLKQLINKLQQHNQALKQFIENLKSNNITLLNKNSILQKKQQSQNLQIYQLNQNLIQLNLQLHKNNPQTQNYRNDLTTELKTIKEMDSQVDVDYDGQIDQYHDQYHTQRQSSIDMERNEKGLAESHEIQSLRTSQQLNINLRQNQAFKQSFQSNKPNNNQIQTQPLSQSGYQYKLRPTIQRNSIKYQALLKKSQMQQQLQENHTTNIQPGDDSQKTLIASINKMTNQSQKYYETTKQNIHESQSSNQDQNQLKQIELNKKSSSVTQLNPQQLTHQNNLSQQQQPSIENDTIQNSQTNITQKTQNIIQQQINHIENDIINKQLQQTYIQSQQNTKIHDNILKSPSQSSQSLINSRKADSPQQEHQFTKKQEKFQIYNASNYHSNEQQIPQNNHQNYRLTQSNRFYSDRYVSPTPLTSSQKTLHHSQGQHQQSLNSISQISTFRTQKIIENKFKIQQNHTQIHTITQSHLPTQSTQKLTYKQIKPQMSSIPQQKQYSSKINQSSENQITNHNPTQNPNRISMDSNMSMLSKIISGNKPINYNQQKKQNQNSSNSQNNNLQSSQNISKQNQKQQEKQPQNYLNKQSKSVLSESNSIQQSIKQQQQQNYFNSNSKPNSILSYQQAPNPNPNNIFPIYSAKDVSMKLQEQSLSSRQSISNQSNVIKSVQLGVVVSRPIVSPPKNNYNYVENRYPSPNKVVIVQKLGRSSSPQQIQQGQLRTPQFVNPTIQRISTNYVVSSRQTSPIQSGHSIPSKISETQANQKLFQTFNPRKQNIYTQQQKSPQSKSSTSQNRSLSPPSPRTIIITQKVQNIPQIHKNSYILKTVQPQIQHQQIVQNINNKERVSAIMQLDTPIIRKSISLQQKNQFTKFNKIQPSHITLSNSNNLNRIDSTGTLKSAQRPTSTATIKNTPNTESMNIYGIQDQKQFKFNQVKTISQISSPRYSNRPFTHNSSNSQIQSQNSQIQSQNQYYSKSTQSSKQQIQQNVFSSKHKIVDNLSQSNSSGIEIQQKDSMANCCPSC